jgi:hypothetical protein
MEDALGFGEAEIKSEGEPTGYGSGPPDRKPRARLLSLTEWPRRKIARALQRAADLICRDTDEGW